MCRCVCCVVVCCVGVDVWSCGWCVLRGWCVLFCFFLSIIFFLFLDLSFLLSLSFFSLLFLFLSSLLFSPPNTVERTDQPTRRPTSRHLNVIWRTASAQQSVLSLLLSPPSSLLPLSSSKKEGTFYYRNISGEEFIFYYIFLHKFQKIVAGENYSHYSFILIQKPKGCNCNDFVWSMVVYRTALLPSRNRPVVADILVKHCNHLLKNRYVATSVLHELFLSCPNHQMKELQMSFRPMFLSLPLDRADFLTYSRTSNSPFSNRLEARNSG